MPAAPPLFKDPKQILLALAQTRSLPELLTLIVERLAASPRIALARVWLVRPGDVCDTCRFRSECPDRTNCLHLVASAGSSRAEPAQDWTGIGGAFRRFPIGVRKVGLIASQGKAIEVQSGIVSSNWIVDSEWARREQLEGFLGEPLQHRGEVLGVLAVFCRGELESGCIDWLRMIANHAAAALVNARAFDEIEALRARLEWENDYLKEEVREAQSLGEIIGASPALEAVGRKISLVAPTDSAVLIQGESGTGKELVAREIHRQSQRAEKPMIKVNCAAIPRELFESEFFGHAKGSFTGALRDRAGRFELAHGGTLLLDEVGEIPLELQAKLLRVLQEGEFERVGEERTRKVNVRVIAATHRDLRREAEAGRFRSDLYYRLSVFPIEVPPLRERGADIPLLAEAFLASAARRLGRKAPKLTRAVVQRLQRYPWPGNVRELQHVIERAVLTSSGAALEVELPDSATARISSIPAAQEAALVRTDAELRTLERENLRAALAAADGKIYGKGGAAELLGVRPTTLASRMKALGLDNRSLRRGPRS
ncbi:MAG: sigma 54-interacting transcriptional regulator [Planctomycetes bacterium]|nr:sigma 54-interacting transcriptional regulator [Planctomycetota bacterium]